MGNPDLGATGTNFMAILQSVDYSKFVGGGGKIMNGRGWSWVVVTKLWFVVGVVGGRGWSHDLVMGRSITKLCNHPRQSTTSHDYPRPPTTSHNFATTTHDHSLPPTTRHKFAAITHDQPQFHPHHPRPLITSHYFTATTHSHPRPTIIKSPLPTNNDSLAATLFAVANPELYFCHHYSPSRIPKPV